MKQPYDMATMMIVSMHPGVSTYADNAITTASPVNPYLASGSATSNLGRITQPPGGLSYIPPSMPSLANNYL